VDQALGARRPGVQMPMRRMPEFTQFNSVKSMMQTCRRRHAGLAPVCELPQPLAAASRRGTERQNGGRMRAWLPTQAPAPDRVIRHRPTLAEHQKILARQEAVLLARM
jgi:hypothetical protein